MVFHTLFIWNATEGAELGGHESLSIIMEQTLREANCSRDANECARGGIAERKTGTGYFSDYSTCDSP